MSEWFFSSLLVIAAAYIACGGMVAVLFFARWIKRFELPAVEGSWGFRFLITPGLVVLWPLVVRKVHSPEPVAAFQGAEGLRRAHWLTFLLLAVFGVVVFTTALVWRAPAFADLPAVELPAP
ncbi:MAG: hypothetical protein ACRDBP_04140 [Luteolibacter sp.]